MITQDSFIRFMHENVPKSCTHMHDLTQVSCMNLAKIHNMIMQEIFAWVYYVEYNITKQYSRCKLVPRRPTVNKTARPDPSVMHK